MEEIFGTEPTLKVSQGDPLRGKVQEKRNRSGKGSDGKWGNRTHQVKGVESPGCVEKGFAIEKKRPDQKAPTIKTTINNAVQLGFT